MFQDEIVAMRKDIGVVADTTPEFQSAITQLIGRRGG